MSDEKLTRTTGALLVAVRNHVEQLVGGKHVDASKLRLTVAEQQEQARALVGAGLTHREAAKALGVGKGTIQRAVDRIGPKADQSGPSKTPEPKPTKPAADSPEAERKEQRWAATSNLIDGILLFDGHKPGDGFEMAAAYDHEVAALRREKITPERIRNAIAFLEEVATALERQNAQAA
jgi:hypothetical protein